MIKAKIQCAKAADDYLEVVRHDNGLTQTTSYGYPLLSKKSCKLLAKLVVADDEQFKIIADSQKKEEDDVYLHD